MKKLLIFLFILIVLQPGSAQVAAPIYKDLYARYDKYKESTIRNRRFKHADVMNLIKKPGAPYELKALGKSIEGRDIYMVKMGKGPVTVLLWSQMHGDEPTATMAIMDILNFFRSSDELDPLRKRLLQNLTIAFIPMLNPDGAERFMRHNALGIDLNRDALRLVTPEARILKQTRDELQAVWGFNLHDQNPYYSAGRQDRTASISFLAPPFNYNRDVNTVRGNAMKLIGLMNDILQQYIPGKVGRYSDAFEPRAFGDNITKWGTSTILIETGGLKGDPEKQELRKLNFTIILSALDYIANKSYEPASINSYKKIPYNDSGKYHDLIIREVEIEKNGQWYLVDLGFRRSEINFNSHREFYYNSSIIEIGDLSTFYAYETLQAKGCRAAPGKVYPTVVRNWSELKKLDPLKLLEQGYTDVRIDTLPLEKEFFELPIRLISTSRPAPDPVFLGQNPSLLLYRDGQLSYCVVNGFLFDLEKDRESIRQMFDR